MGRGTRYTTEQIVAKLRKAEVMLTNGKTVEDVVKALEVTPQTYYRWKKEYGSLGVDQAKRLKELEKENNRLKKIIADQALDISVLKEYSSGNF